MSLLIDGYNLMYASGMLGRGIGPGRLERSRRALLNFLAATIDEQERARTTVVFDAKGAPPGLPSQARHQGIAVRFARNHQEADDLIEELIRADSAPRRLTVVSSDHRLHRAAQRRRAMAVDSDVWYERQCRERSRQPGSEIETEAPKPEPPLSEEDVRQWVERFGGADVAPEGPFPPGYGTDLD